MACQVKVVADSITPRGCRITTFQLRYWRAIHAEFMTHRVFSRNASSSRAIPVIKVVEQVLTDPAGPIHWGANQPGMQANGEVDAATRAAAEQAWREAAADAVKYAQRLMDLGIHKQVANRLLEPFQYINVVCTATEWENWYALRDHSAAMPEIQELARTMREEHNHSTPRLLQPGEWHLPYVVDAERESDSPIGDLLKLSTARCARVSYNRHDGTPAPYQEDFDLHDRLVIAAPPHMSPAEHQAVAMPTARRIKNMRGWRMYRDLLETA